VDALTSVVQRKELAFSVQLTTMTLVESGTVEAGG
jgi:hypothetical protein